MIYLFSTQLYEEQNELIIKICRFQGEHIHVASLADENLKPYFKKYFKGNNPAIVFSNDFLDTNPKNVNVVYGFWNFVEYFMKNKMIRC